METKRAGTNDLWEAIYTQRAIRAWEDRPVPRELLLRVIEAGTKAPSGSNLQPWRFVVVQDLEKRKAIAAEIRDWYESNPRVREYIEQQAESGDRSTRLMLRGARRLFLGIDGAPALIVPCLYHVTSPSPDPASLLAGSSIYQAVQNIMLAARGLGLGTVMTTFHAGIDGLLRELLKLPDDAYPVALIPIGYPAANFGPTNRRPVEEVTFWEEWSATGPGLDAG